MACATDPPNMTAMKRAPIQTESVTLVFRAGYDVTWQAALKAMDQYNLKITNKDAGTLITETTTKYDDAYETPTAIRTGSMRTPIHSYIETKVTPIEKAEDGFSRTEVSIIKYLEKGDEFSSKQIKSNMVEEQVILYRIKRLLELERMKFERTRN
jgi:hypothetical protein